MQLIKSKFKIYICNPVYWITFKQIFLGFYFWFYHPPERVLKVFTWKCNLVLITPTWTYPQSVHLNMPLSVNNTYLNVSLKCSLGRAT